MVKKRRFPWQQNFLKVPSNIQAKIGELPSDDIVVACVKKIPSKDLRAGIYRHLDMSLREGELVFPERIVPAPNTGRYSGYSVNGRVIRLEDLPMITRTYSFESPNWGDWSKGSHTTEWSRLVYRRTFHPPQFLAIEIELVGEELAEDNLVFRFRIDRVLNRTVVSFPVC